MIPIYSQPPLQFAGSRRSRNSRPKKHESVRTKKLSFLLASLLAALLTIAAVSVDRLRGHVTWLADPAREGRHAGSPGAAAAAEYLTGKFMEIGFDVRLQEFGGNRRNVVARAGTAERHILIGAHYDGQGAGMPSASDNAAGVAVMLEVARELRSKELPVSLVAVGFDYLIKARVADMRNKDSTDPGIIPIIHFTHSTKRKPPSSSTRWGEPSWTSPVGPCSFWAPNTRVISRQSFKKRLAPRCWLSAPT